ncbi:MAG: SDR family NAD(P)-dependent oxidoreductase [Alphaproteobacteria bacterium]
MADELARSGVKLPEIDLAGSVALITGGDRGLGKSMAEAIVRCGGRVSIASVDPNGCIELADELNARHGTGVACGFPLDVTNLAQCREGVKKTVSQFGKLNILFNNARRLMRGPGLPPTGNSLPIWETDPDIYAETVTVNVIGTFNMARAAVEYFRSQNGGKILNVSTSLRNFSFPNNSPYGVTKTALESQTLIWAAECEAENIMINSICPGGAVDSDLSRPDRESRELQPVDIMDSLAVWLASEHSDGVTGCRFNAKFWDPSINFNEAARGAREEPVFALQPEGRFSVLD